MSASETSVVGSDRTGDLPSSAPVLIVGAGPVGLALARELAFQGTRCVIIDKGDGVVRHSKMGLVSIRTMELCRRWGLAQAVRDAGFPPDYALNQAFCTSLNGHLLALSPRPSMRDEDRPDSSPERRQRCPQIWFDPIMARAVAQDDRILLRYECELRGFSQNPDGVTAQLTDVNSGRSWFLKSAYLVGCDGAGSQVRTALDIPMMGDQVLNYSVAVYFRCPGLLSRHDKGPAERYIMVGPEGSWGHLTVVDGSELWRLTVMGKEDKFDMGSFDPHYWIRRCIGADNVDYTVISILPWRRSRLVAERFSKGRVFICGDAVHVMSPNGGHGMNTGMCDALDLAWKLTAVLNGWGGPALLDSYEAERRPVGVRNTNAAAETFSKIMRSLECAHVMDHTERGEAERRVIGRTLEAAGKGNQDTLGIALGYRYENSPICVPDNSPATPDDPAIYVQTSRPGHRAPHAWLGPDQSTLDLFKRDFVLMIFGANAGDAASLVLAAQKRGVPLTVRRIDDAAIADLYERRFVLVRPDGHVAWRGDSLPQNPEALIEIVRGAGREQNRTAERPVQTAWAHP